MTEGVVDRLEVIKINLQEPEAAACAGKATAGGPEILVELLAVARARQLVGASGYLQRAVDPLEFGPLASLTALELSEGLDLREAAHLTPEHQHVAGEGRRERHQQREDQIPSVRGGKPTIRGDGREEDHDGDPVESQPASLCLAAPWEDERYDGRDEEQVSDRECDEVRTRYRQEHRRCADCQAHDESDGLGPMSQGTTKAPPSYRCRCAEHTVDHRDVGESGRMEDRENDDVKRRPESDDQHRGPARLPGQATVGGPEARARAHVEVLLSSKETAEPLKSQSRLFGQRDQHPTSLAGHGLPRRQNVL